MKIPGRYILIMLFCLPVMLYGRIAAEVDNLYPGTGESFNLRITTDSKIKYRLEGAEELEVLGRSSSSSISVINGKRTSEYTEVYQLLAPREGIYSLQAVAEDERSNIVDIEVGGMESSPQEERKFFIQVEPERKTYYFGEKIPYEESLVITENISDISYIKLPDFGDMSVVEVNPGMRIGSKQKKTRIGGREALEILLYQGVLEPSSSGSKKIGGSLVRVASGGGGFYRGTTHSLAGETREIEVLPLPGGAPEGFKNIVGRIEADVSMDRTRLNPGEAATMSVTISGEGSLKGVDTLVSERNPDFTIYENLLDEREWIEGERYKNERTYQIAFVPRRRGEYSTPEIRIPYFDPQKEEYATLVIESREIEADGVAEPRQQVAGGADSGRRIEVNMLPERVEAGSKRSIWVYILAAIAALQGGLIIYLVRDRLKLTLDTDPLKKIRRSRSDEEIYSSYCEYMRREYGFNPKAHSGDRLEEDELRKLYSEIEEKRFRGEPLDKKRICEILKLIRR